MVTPINIPKGGEGTKYLFKVTNIIFLSKILSPKIFLVGQNFGSKNKYGTRTGVAKLMFYQLNCDHLGDGYSHLNGEGW